MNAVRDALAAGDAGWLSRFWARIWPHLPGPASSAEAEIMMHHARTQAESLPLAKRLYSHAWLDERGLPSGLPDALRPWRSEPRIVRAVGVGVRGSRLPRADARELERVMAEAGGAAILAGVMDNREISRAMWAARDRFLRRY
jgi:hypothetical protein